MLAHQADAYIGIRVPEPIKKDWQEQADREHRSLSNWILHRLTGEESPAGSAPTDAKKSKR